MRIFHGLVAAFILTSVSASTDPDAIVLNLTDAADVVAAGSASVNAMALPKSQDFITPPP
jgi:hypothetical protein